MVMAESLDDDEFWLPPHFLADDDNILDQKSSTTNKNNDQNYLGSNPFHSGRASFPRPFEFGTFGRFLDSSSPGEALKCSRETQRDEEGSVAGLTLRMARSTIDDGRVFSGSPQSTLWDMGSTSGCSQVSSRGSPKGDCKAQSPPATWDLLHAVAEEVARMRMNDTHGVLNQNRETSQVSVPVKNSSTGTGFYQKLHGLQHLQQKEIMQQQNFTVGEQINSDAGYQQQHIHQMVQNGVRGCRGFSSPAWPPPPQGSGMRTLFLGSHGGKKECTGTGVFLPRHTSTQSEERRKPACSTVLVPARVMKALNLKLEDICSQPHLEPVAGGRFNSENDVLLRLQINRRGNYKKRNIRQPPPIDHEIKLPQDWTY